MSKSPRRKKHETVEGERQEETPPADIGENPDGPSAGEPSGGDVPEDAQGSPAEPLEVADPLEVMRQERDAFQEKWLRVVAEMDNLRKRSSRELLDSRRLAQAEVLRPLLGVMDDFERALQALRENQDGDDREKFLEGVSLIVQNFHGVLKDLGAVPMEVLDHQFDPVFHEAVGQLPREGVESGRVIEVLQNGFMFQDQVLRPARVIISA